MREIQKFLIVDIEYESRTSFDNFASIILQQAVPNLYLLDLKQLSAIPELKGVNQPTTIEEKFQLIGQYMDQIVIKDAQNAGKPKKPVATKGAVQFGEDAIKSDKYILLLANFQFGEELVLQYNDQQQKNHQNYMQLLQQFISKLNDKVSFEADNNYLPAKPLGAPDPNAPKPPEFKNFDEFPEYPQQQSVYEKFSLLQRKAGIAISAYLTITEDFDASSLIKSLEGFDEFLNRTGFEPKKTDLYDVKLFSYTYNHYKKFNTNLPKPNMFQTVLPVEEKKRRNVRVQRDPSVAHLCNNDGSVNYTKLANYIRDNSYLSNPDENVNIVLIPTWNCQGFSVYQKVADDVFPQYKAKPPKDEKALQQFMKDSLGKMDFSPQLQKFVTSLNKFLYAPVLYQKMTNKAMLVGYGSYDEMKETADEFKDFRHIIYYDVDKSIVQEQEGFPQLLELSKPVKGQPERCGVRTQIGFYSDHLNVLELWDTPEGRKQIETENEKKNILKRLKNLHKKGDEFNLKTYQNQLDILQFEDQNRIGCIVEAMLRQLEELHPSLDPTGETPADQKRPPSGAAGRPKSGAKKEPPAKKDKNAVEEPKIPCSQNSLLEFKPSEAEVLINLITYDKNKKIDPDINDILNNYGFGCLEAEKTMTFEKKESEVPENAETQQIELQEKPKQKPTEMDKFLAASLSLERKAAIYPVTLLKKIVENREKSNADKLEVAEKENARLRRLDFVEQYEQYKQKKAAFERDQKMAKLKAAKSKKGAVEEKQETYPHFAYTPQFQKCVADIQDIPLNAKFLMKLNKLIFDFCQDANQTQFQAQIATLFEQLDLISLNNDAKDDIVQVALCTAKLPRSDLFVRAKLNQANLLQVVPRFTQFCQNRSIKTALMAEIPLERLALQKYLYRSKFIQDRTRHEIYDQPYFLRPDEQIDIRESGDSYVKVAELSPDWSMQLLTACFGTIGCQIMKEVEKDDSIEKYENTLKQIADSMKTEEELKQEEEERQKAAEEAIKQAELNEKKSPARAKSSGRKREEVQVEEATPFPFVDSDFQVHHFNKFFEDNYLKISQKVPGFDNEAKIPLDLTTFGDFEAEVPSIYTERDFQPGDIRALSKVQFNELGINVITSDPSASRIRHIMINNQLGPIKLSFNGYDLKEQEIQPEIAEVEEWNNDEIQEPVQENFFVVQSKAGSAMAQQTSEMRKRKKKLTEYIEACNKERDRRQAITTEYVKLQTYQRLPSRSKLSIDIPVNNAKINFINNKEFQAINITTGSTEISIRSNKTIKLTKEYRNVVVRDISLDENAQFHQLLKTLREKLSEVSKQKIAELQLSELISSQSYLGCATYRVNVEDELTNVELISFNADDFMNQHKETLNSMQPIPNYGTKVLQNGDLFMAQTFNHLYSSMSRQQLSQIDIEKLIPISQSRALRQLAITSKFYYGEFNNLNSNEGVILDKFNDDMFQFNNFIQELFDNKQNYPTKHFKAVLTHLAAAQLRRFIALPSGLALAEVDSGMLKIIYTNEHLSQLITIKSDGTIDFEYNDQLKIRYVNNSVVINGIYTYNINLCQLLNIYDIGKPISECYIRANKPNDFLPDIYQLMCKNEKLPKSMWKFLLKQVYPQRIEYQIPQELYAKFTSNSYKLIFLDQNENIEKILYEDSDNVNKFLQDYALEMKSISMLVPQSFFPLNFEKIKFQRMKLDIPFEKDLQKPKTFAQILESLQDVPVKKDKPVKQWKVDENQQADDRPMMKLLYYDKNEYGCYWETPEGQRFNIQDINKYQEALQGYVELSENVLNPSNIYKQHKNVSKNMIKQAQKQERKMAVPRVLERPTFKAPQAHKIIFDTEKRMFEVTGLKEMQKNLENQMIYESIQSQEALACKNEEYMQFEGKSLRQTKTMKMSGDIYRRFINITPDHVLIKTTVEDLENLYKTQLDEINDKRIKMGLQPKAALNPNNKIVKLYTSITLKNHGTEAANVRLSRINDSVIKYISFPELKGCGLPPGIAHQAVIELWLDLDKLKPDQNIYDAVVIRTEEEVLSIPLTIMFSDEQTIDDSRMDRPIGYEDERYDDNFDPDEEAIELDDMTRDYDANE